MLNSNCLPHLKNKTFRFATVTVKFALLIASFFVLTFYLHNEVC